MTIPNNPALPEETALLTIVDVARHLSVSRSKVYRLMRQSQLPYVKLGRCRRIKGADVVKVVEKSTVSGGEE